MRPIDADALISKMIESCNPKTCYGDCFDCNYPAAINDIEGAPTLDVAPVVHAYWIEDIGLNGDPYYICSRCGDCFNTTDGDHPLVHGFDYCPKCGAKMDGKRKEGAE